MKVGRTTFTEEGLSQMTKMEFLTIYKGKLDEDIEQVAKRFNKYFKKNVPTTKKISSQYKDVKIQVDIQDSFSE